EEPGEVMAPSGATIQDIMALEAEKGRRADAAQTPRKIPTEAEEAGTPDLSTLTYNQLRTLAKERGLDARGTKAAILARLQAREAAPTTPAVAEQEGAGRSAQPPQPPERPSGAPESNEATRAYVEREVPEGAFVHGRNGRNDL